ncbi:MAG: hypothetical protein GY760_06785 [Deltaproteobacteria bacterium]|nr:hypothetical protein [Deltaproteobacteria bacterium]
MKRDLNKEEEEQHKQYKNGILHISAKNGDLEATLSSIQKKISVNRKNKFGQTPLHYAVLYGTYEIVDALINAGAEIDTIDEFNHTPLILRLQDYLYQCDYMDEYPLKILKKEDAEKIALLLIEKGADLTIQDENGDSLLLHASRIGYLRVVKKLVEKGMDVNKKSDSKLILDEALSNEHSDVADFLIDSGAKPGRRSIFYAVQNNRALVDRMLEKGLKLNANFGGDTLLHRASFYRVPDVVELLLSHNLLVDKKNDDGKTPLYNAVEIKEETEDELKIVKLLVEAGADIHARREMYRAESPFELAYKNELEKTVEYFKEKTSMTIDDMFALRKSFLEDAFFKQIINEPGYHAQSFINSCNIDINAKNADGKTPLHIAVGKKDNDLIETLILSGADPSIKNSEGQTAIELANVLDDNSLSYYIKCKPNLLTKDLKSVVSLLQPGATPDKIADAAKILKKNKKLWQAISSREINLLSHGQSQDIRQLGSEIGKNKNRQVTQRCDSCGRDTLKLKGSKHISGSPSTPAYEAEYKCDCLSCGSYVTFTF